MAQTMTLGRESSEKPAPHPCMRRSHGGGVRGSDSVSRSLTLEGRFGRLFRTLPAATYGLDALAALANAMTSLPDVQTPETEVDLEENQGINAGYTYLGQFIDHDLTFDPASSLIKANDPDALTDFRTPRFDLDNLYGRGPDDQPYLYEEDGLHLQLGRILSGNPHDAASRDVPRHQSAAGGAARALIGDPRNDENVIVSQLQSTMIRFHNRIVDDNPGASLAEIQQIVRWHYQYVVLNDFLPTIVNASTLESILPNLSNGTSIAEDPPRLTLYKYKHSPFIPIEFSAAAYRFGHSMVRPIYRLNTTLVPSPPVPGDAVNGRQVIFDPRGDNFSLTGFREFPSQWAIDWNLFFDLGNNAPHLGVDRLQKAYKIDTSLVNPLGALPLSIAPSLPSLAHLNLVRGFRMGLPSGQDVARAMGLVPIDDASLMLGKATSDKADLRFASIVELPEFGAEFAGKAPLWYYVLAEAQQHFVSDATPIRLGEVGGRIVTETFVGLMLADSHSYLAQNPRWTPAKKNFRMGDLINMAIGQDL